MLFLVISFCVANPVMVIGDNVLSGSNSSFDLKWVGNSDNENYNDIDEVAITSMIGQQMKIMEKILVSLFIGPLLLMKSIMKKLIIQRASK